MTATVRLKQQLGDAVELAFSRRRRRGADRALADALELLQRIAAADDKRLVLFLDEFQELAAPRKPYRESCRTARSWRVTASGLP